VIVTSGSDFAIPTGFDNFVRSKAPEDLRRLGPIRIKKTLTKEWGTSHFRGRIAGQSVSGIELPPLSALRRAFEVRCNGGKPISWPGITEWGAPDDGTAQAPASQPTAQSAEDIGTPGEEDTAL
jgi:hypothetical protein